MECESTVTKFLSGQDKAYPLVMGQQQMIMSRPFGACCDPAFADIPSALLLERYSSVRFLFRRVTVNATPAGAAIGDLVLNSGPGSAPGQQFPSFFFAGGSDTNVEAQTGIWEAQNYGHTNLYPGGAPVDRGQLFLCLGHSFEIVGVVGRAFASAAAQTFSASDAVISPRYALIGSGSYETRILKAVMQRIYAIAQFGNTTKQYLLGTLADAPSMTGLFGNEQITVGQPITGTYKPYTSVFVINARDESQKLTVATNIATPTSGAPTLPIIPQDPGNTTPAAANGAQGGTDGNLYLEIKMRMFGVPLCGPELAICNAPSGPLDDSALKAALADFIRRNPGAIAQLAAAQGGAPSAAGWTR